MKRNVNGTIRPNENLKKSKTVLQIVSKIRSVLPLLWLVYNVRAWRCGDIPCYVSPDMLLIKDMKMKIYSKAGLYSSVGYVAE